MLSRVNSLLWMDDHQNNGALPDPITRDDLASLSSFKSMLHAGEDDQNWFLPPPQNNNNHQLSFSTNNLILQQVPIDSSSSCSPSSSSSAFNNLHPSQVHYFLPPKTTVASIMNYPMDNSFDLGFDSGLFQTRGTGVLSGFIDMANQNHLRSPNLNSNSHFSTTHLLQLPGNAAGNGNGFGSGGFPGFEEGSGTSLFLNRSKLLKPLDNFTSIGAQPTLFQKRAALRKNLTDPAGNFDEENEMKRKASISWDDMDNLSFDGSGMNYDSDDYTENYNNSKFDQESVKNGENSPNANSTVIGAEGDQKGKKKGLPAKNLMAERRRRKKLNDRLYMLRSVVPKISKFLSFGKEKLQRVQIQAAAADYPFHMK